MQLKRGHRLAFTTRPPDRDDIHRIIDALYVGRRDTRDRTKDTWHVVHDLLGEDNPPTRHVSNEGAR